MIFRRLPGIHEVNIEADEEWVTCLLYANDERSG